MLEVEKLYVCEKYHLLLYQDQETAGTAARAAAAAARRSASAAPNSGNPATYATFWSNHLRKPVSYVDKNTIILVLNSKEKFYEVLAGDRKGWIICQDWLNIKEIDYA